MGETSTVKKKGYMQGFKDGIPIGLGYIPVSMACGISAAKAGLSFGMSEIMSLLMYTGSGQAAGLNLFVGGETAIMMYIITLFVMNCRYILFSVSIAQKFDKSMGTLQRIGFGLFNTDEIFGVAMQQKGLLNSSYLFGLATVPYIGFIVGNTLGACFTSLLPASVVSALGIMLCAMFIAIIVPAAKESKPVLFVVLIALVLSFVLECIPFIKANLTSGWTIIICAVVTSLIGAIAFPIEEEAEETVNE